MKKLILSLAVVAALCCCAGIARAQEQSPQGILQIGVAVAADNSMQLVCTQDEAPNERELEKDKYRPDGTLQTEINRVFDDQDKLSYRMETTFDAKARLQSQAFFDKDGKLIHRNDHIALRRRYFVKAFGPGMAPQGEVTQYDAAGKMTSRKVFVGDKTRKLESEEEYLPAGARIVTTYSEAGDSMTLYKPDGTIEWTKPLDAVGIGTMSSSMK